MNHIGPKETIRTKLKELSKCNKCGNQVIGNSQIPTGSLTPKLAIVAQNPPTDPKRRVGGFLIHIENPKLNRIEKIIHKLVFQELELEPQEIYCTQTVKCPTPKNTVKKSIIKECCKKFLAKELEIINAKVWLAVGRVATENIELLLGEWSNKKIEQLPSRPNCFDYFIKWGRKGSKNIVTAPHPTISGRFVLPGSWETNVANAVKELW